MRDKTAREMIEELQIRIGALEGAVEKISEDVGSNFYLNWKHKTHMFYRPRRPKPAAKRIEELEEQIRLLYEYLNVEKGEAIPAKLIKMRKK